MVASASKGFSDLSGTLDARWKDPDADAYIASTDPPGLTGCRIFADRINKASVSENCTFFESDDLSAARQAWDVVKNVMQAKLPLWSFDNSTVCCGNMQSLTATSPASGGPSVNVELQDNEWSGHEAAAQIGKRYTVNVTVNSNNGAFPPQPAAAAADATQSSVSIAGNGYIGVELQQQNDTITIHLVMPGSPAEEGGLRQNDTLLSINGEHVKTINDATALVTASRPGSHLRLQVLRGGNVHSVTVTVAQRTPGASASGPI